ncbi:hypothetical protein CC86DRAFT_384303 [Ophiobolus disseminans]|uniref:Subtelomeric hrmA-associated cluster protein AFUB-079030/YDR124W-like helical bundle domain-containing protein n=1 Tax=Ophiobolus disseminans TaxID=1469910 RepID=A0A6A6ZSJ3_9PLEO|nr:hypothetical protein CC86DRAFT_384303 [Ophiobolus disseminans]
MARLRDADMNQKAMQRQWKLDNFSDQGNEKHDDDRAPNSGFRDAAAGTVTKPPAIVPTTKPYEDNNDDEAIPTPINATLEVQQCTITTSDGRSAIIPIVGFEHLFRARQSDHGTPSCSYALQPRSRQELAHIPGPNQRPARNGESRPPHRTSSGLNVRSRRRCAPEPANGKAVKKRRRGSIAQTRPQPRTARNTDDDEQNEQDEMEVATETSYSFRMGDIEGMKRFFKRRIDELTMKPVRGMVTTWIKQLEPRRQGLHGPYHRQLPSAMPKDATPPWWPHDVRYLEPAHLGKEDLKKLAVELMLQHRGCAIDVIKRQYPRGWTEKIRSVAQYAVENTPEEHFSSSKNILFSRSMKKRALNSILPSVFEISQSYEDYVQQHALWNYAEKDKLPQGKTVTWQHVPRPPKQISQQRRVRARTASQAPRDESDVYAHDATSGYDTEPDDTMEGLVLSPQPEVKVALTESPPTFKVSTPVPAAAVPSIETAQPAVRMQLTPCSSFDQSFKVSTPVPAVTVPSIETAQPAVRTTPCSSFGQSASESSFGDSVNYLDLDEDVKGSSSASLHRQEPQANCFDQALHDTNTGYMLDPFRQNSHFMPYSASSYIDPREFSLYHNNYPIATGAPPLGSSMAPSNVMYEFAPDGSFVPANGMASFDGLPNFGSAAMQQQFGGSHMTSRMSRQ